MNLDNLACAMVVKNGGLTIRESIISIVDLVSRLYIVDHGSDDDTVSIVNDLSKTYNNIVIFDGRGISYSDARNLIIQKAVEKYLLKWDDDFIALRKKFGAPRDIGDFLRLAIDLMEKNKNNLCLIKALNIGFGLDCIIKDRPYVGLSGDIRIYKRDCAEYSIGRYADEFHLVNETPSRLYLNKEDDLFYMLHLDLLKNPENIALRDFKFAYQIDFESSNGLTFDEWLNERVKKSKKQIVKEKIESKISLCSRTALTSQFIRCDFYKQLNSKSPFIYSFDDLGRVVALEAK